MSSIKKPKMTQETDLSKSNLGQKSLIVEHPSFFHSMVSPTSDPQKACFAIE